MTHAVDDAWHPVRNRHAIEWWYVTLLCDDGDVYAGRLYTAGDHVEGGRCGLDLYAYPGEGAPWEVHDRYPAEAFYAERDRPFVMVEGSSIEARDGALRLAVRSADLVLQAEAVSLVDWPDHVVRRPMNSTQGFLWTVPMLRGRFEGTIHRGIGRGRGLGPRPLRGILFHDHVFADIGPSLDTLRNYRGGWWGVVYGERSSLLFLDVDYHGAPMQFAVSADDDGVSVVHGAEGFPARAASWDPPQLVVLVDGAWRGATIERLHRKRQVSPSGGLRDRLVNALSFTRKWHGIGHVDGRRLYFERIRFL